MMKVLDTFRIKGRGLVVTTVLDGPCPLLGVTLVRVRDGQTWTVRGVERFCKFLGTVGTHGESINILLSHEECDPVADDDLERW